MELLSIFKIQVYIFAICIIVYNNPKVQGKKTALEKIGEVVDIMKKSSSDSGQLLAGMKFILKILDEEGPQERSTLRSDSAQSIR